MNARRVLQGTFWATIFIQTLGAIDIGPKAKEPKRKMPSPKEYVAIIVVWTILGWVAQLSDNVAKAAATLSGLLLLTTLFYNSVKPDRFTVAGSRLVNFFNKISDTFGIQPPQGGAGASETEPPTDEGSLV